MPKPTLSTISRLYCVSGNRCAYPDCNTPLLEPTSKVLMAEVCHIKADQPNGPRYDATQSDAERHGFGNLIIMCCNHHKVIDTDLRTWTVERLLALKSGHENSATVLPEPSAELVQQLLATISVVVDHLTNGSVITTINQSGGQVAYQIINQGEPRRVITSTQLDQLVRLLGDHPPDKFFIMAPIGYSEAFRLGEVLYATLKRANWRTNSDNVAQLMGTTEPIQAGVLLLMNNETPAIRTFAEWCGQVGLRPSIQVGKLPPLYWPDTLNIIIGPAPED